MAVEMRCHREKFTGFVDMNMGGKTGRIVLAGSIGGPA